MSDEAGLTLKLAPCSRRLVVRQTTPDLSRIQKLAKIVSWEWDHGNNYIRLSENIRDLFKLDRTVQELDLEAVFNTFLQVDDQQRMRAYVHELRSGNAAKVFESKVICGNGEIKYFRSTIEFIEFADDQLSSGFGILQDITEQKISEQYLRMYELIVSTTSDLMAFIDTQFIYRSVNQAYQLFFGKQESEIIGRYVHELITGDYYENLVKPNLEKAMQGELVRFSGRYKPDEDKICDLQITYYPFYDDQGSVRGVVVNVHDMTDQKRAHRALIHSQLRYQSLFNDADDCIHIVNEQGKFIDVNQQELSMLGYTFDEMMDMYWQDIIAPECKVLNQEQFSAICNGRKNLRYETIFMTKHGKRIPVEVNVSPELLKDRVITIRAISRDISMYKSTERELQRHRQDLERMVRLRTAELETSNKELEAFSYSVSHDLRTPLRAINGFSQLLREDCGDMLDEHAIAYIKRIESASRDMGNLIDALLNLSRISRKELDMTEINLSEMCRSLISTLTIEIKTSLTINIHDALRVSGDRKLIRIAMENLLDNAVKYSALNTRAIIEVGYLEHYQDKRDVYFVKDNGVGFDMNYREKLFQPFQRLHDPGQFPGTGIGLATVQRIIRRHEGTIWAESDNKRGGSCFYFTLHSHGNGNAEKSVS